MSDSHFGKNDIHRNVAISTLQKTVTVDHDFRLERQKEDYHLYVYIGDRAYFSFVISPTFTLKEYHSYKGLYMSWRLDREPDFDPTDIGELKIEKLLGPFSFPAFKELISNLENNKDNPQDYAKTKRAQKLQLQKERIEQMKQNAKAKNQDFVRDDSESAQKRSCPL